MHSSRSIKRTDPQRQLGAAERSGSSIAGKNQEVERVEIARSVRLGKHVIDQLISHMTLRSLELSASR